VVKNQPDDQALPQDSRLQKSTPLFPKIQAVSESAWKPAEISGKYTHALKKNQEDSIFCEHIPLLSIFYFAFSLNLVGIL